MASGDTLAYFTPAAGVPPATVFATLDTFASGDTPTQTFLVLDFDDSQTEFIDFAFVVPSHYTAAANFDIDIGWTCDTAGGTAGVVWDVYFKSVTPDADDLDSKAFGSVQAFAFRDPASAAGEIKLASKTGITFAAAQSPLEGEILFIRLSRDHDGTGGDLTGDAEFHFMEIREAS